MLDVIMLRVIMLDVIMLRVIMLDAGCHYAKGCGTLLILTETLPILICLMSTVSRVVNSNKHKEHLAGK
jgi:hypothetical protein